MRPSRRQLLRVGGLSLAWLGGCSANNTPGNGDTPTPVGFGSPSSPEPTLAPGADTDLGCRSGPLPGSGWPYPAGSWGRTNYAPTARGPIDPPTVAWSALPTEPDNAHNRFTRPLVSDGRVFVGRRLAVPTHTEEPDEQGVIAYDATSGEERWRTWLPRPPGVTALIEGRLVVEDGTAVHALDPSDGTNRWTTETGDGVWALQPTPAGVLVVTHPGGPGQELVALGTDGAVRWRQPMDELVTSTPAWAAGRAYLGGAGGRLLAVDTDEPAVAWSVNLQNGEDTAPTRVVATPCAVFVAIDKALYAVDHSGELVWSSSHGVRELATDGSTVYGVDGDGYVRAFGVADGTLRWERFFGVEDDRYTDGFYEPPAIDGDTLFAGSLDGQLVALATETGRPRWTIERDWETNPRVSVADATLYAAWGRRLIAFR